jgi:hypothetical protein
MGPRQKFGRNPSSTGVAGIGAAACARVGLRCAHLVAGIATV